jgi:hypothetical protein
MTLQAPYRFIPISGWIHTLGWATAASHDDPFEDGVSGWLDLRVTAKTSLLVAAAPRYAAGDGPEGTLTDDDIFPRKSAPPPPPPPAVDAGFAPGTEVVVLEDGVDAVVIRPVGPGRVLVGFEDGSQEVLETRYLRPTGHPGRRGGS